MDVVKNRSNYAFRWACYNNRLKVCEWFYETFPLTDDDARSLNNEALKCACKNNHWDIVKFLFKTCGLTQKDADMIINNLPEDKKDKLLKYSLPLGTFTKSAALR